MLPQDNPNMSSASVALRTALYKSDCYYYYYYYYYYYPNLKLPGR